jgi:SnoaL-like domain
MVALPREARLRALYEAFNAREVDICLAAMTPDVDWANGWEGGRVVGREAVRDYWQRQWAELDSTAEPTAVIERPDGSRSQSTSSPATRRARCSTRARVATSTSSAEIWWSA